MGPAGASCSRWPITRVARLSKRWLLERKFDSSERKSGEADVEEDLGEGSRRCRCEWTLDALLVLVWKDASDRVASASGCSGWLDGINARTGRADRDARLRRKPPWQRTKRGNLVGTNTRDELVQVIYGTVNTSPECDRAPGWHPEGKEGVKC